MADGDGGALESEGVVAIVMGAGAEVGVLADDGAWTDGDLAQRVENGVVADGDAVADVEHPGDFDMGCGPNRDAFADAGAEESQKPGAVAIPVVETAAEQGSADRHPECSGDLAAQGPRAGLGLHLGGSDAGGGQLRLGGNGGEVGLDGVGGRRGKKCDGWSGVDGGYRTFGGRHGLCLVPCGYSLVPALEAGLAVFVIAQQGTELEGHHAVVAGYEAAELVADGAVEDASPEEVHVGKAPKRGEGDPAGDVAFEPPAVAGIGGEIGLVLAGFLAGDLEVQLESLEGGVSVVLGEEMLQAAAVLVEHGLADEADGVIDDHVFMNLAVFVAASPALEEAHVPRGEVTAVADGFAEEVGQPVDEEAIFRDVGDRSPGDLFDLAAESVGDDLVGVENERPVGLEGQVGERPVLLFGVALPIVLDDVGAVLAGDVLGAIGRAAIDYEDLASPALDRLEAVRQVESLVVGDDQDVRHGTGAWRNWTHSPVIRRTGSLSIRVKPSALRR